MHPARCGDQVTGCQPEEAATLLREMARFHATWWDHPRLSSLDWIPMGNDPVNQSAEQAYQDAFEPFLKNFGDRLSPRALAIAERFKDKIIAIEEEFAKPPLTIAHGDLRYDNLYFGADGMAVADWQIVLRARGPYDVAYFMSQSVNPAERRASEMDILRSYHETLLQQGVKGYTFEQCFDDYRACAMFCLVYPVISGGTLDLANDRGAAARNDGAGNCGGRFHCAHHRRHRGSRVRGARSRGEYPGSLTAHFPPAGVTAVSFPSQQRYALLGGARQTRRRRPLPKVTTTRVVLVCAKRDGLACSQSRLA